VPYPEVAVSFDQLVGAQDEARPDLKPDFLCSFQNDDKLEPARLFNRNVARACPPQDFCKLTTQQIKHLGYGPVKEAAVEQVKAKVSRFTSDFRTAALR
jgi:hypothetical protein